MYVIVEGEVDVAYDEERSVRLGAGESFGEMALIEDRPRSATVTAVTDVTLAPPSTRAPSSCWCTRRRTSRSR